MNSKHVTLLCLTLLPLLRWLHHCPAQIVLCGSYHSMEIVIPLDVCFSIVLKIILRMSVFVEVCAHESRSLQRSVDRVSSFRTGLTGEG